MRHGYMTARSTVYWLFKNTAIEACNLETDNKGGRMWWRLAGVVCVVGRLARDSGTFTLLPLPGRLDDEEFDPDTDDEEFELEVEEECAPPLIWGFSQLG